MKTLQEIKDEYAKDWWGCIDWNDAIYYEGMRIDSDDLDRISKQYAKEVAKQALINSSGNFLGESDFAKDVRNSILSENNMPNLD